MYIFLVILGCLLVPFGILLVIWSIPASHPSTSWDASWAEIKDAFRVMFHKSRFQAGLICIIVGLLILWCMIWPISP